MKINLIPIKEKIHRDKYLIVVTFMHGDADHYEKGDCWCDTKEEFLEILSKMDNRPMPTAEGGDEDAYDEWCSDTFGEDFVPHDIIFDVKSTVTRHEKFYYDENGVKFKVEIEA